MNNLNLIIENAAEKDMILIAEYVAKDNKTAATKLLKTFYKSYKKLCLYPKIGIIRPDFTHKNVMFFTVKKRYLIVYTIKHHELHILRVLTAYQDICKLL